MGFPQIDPVTGVRQWAWDPALLDDGYGHHRDQAGFCGNCGARPMEPHYRLLASNS